MLNKTFQIKKEKLTWKKHIRFAGKTILLIMLILLATLLVGCGGAEDRSDELEQAWISYPGTEDWDMHIRSVLSQSKSTGSHMARYTIYLTTYTSKNVPGFAIYDSIDVPPDDSMEFKDRVQSFFEVVTNGMSLFPGVNDPEGFMKWYAANVKDKYFLSLHQSIDSGGKSSWALFASDTEPAGSTWVQDAGKETLLNFDEATGVWSLK